MIKITAAGKEASIINGKWSCGDRTVLELLEVFTSEIELGAHVPDADQFIVLELMKKFPSIQIVSQPAPPNDAVPDGAY